MQRLLNATKFGALAAIACGLVFTSARAQSLPSTGVSAVTTYESAGLYWSAPGANSNGCNVQFRKVGDGRPGPVTQRLRAAFRAYVERTHSRR